MRGRGPNHSESLANFELTKLAIMLGLIASGSVQAATITVGAGCTVVDAVNAANSNAVVASCVAGDAAGTDTIVLSSNAIYTIGSASTFTPYSQPLTSALPSITSNITIQGNGGTITRGAAAADFRIIHVANSGFLRLENLTISNGYAKDSTYSSGGGIYSRGRLELDAVTVTGNRASGIIGSAAGIYSAGTLSVVNSTITANSASGAGGGLKLIGNAPMSIAGTTITGNTAGSGGGLNVVVQSGFSISGSTVSNNVATSTGGGISTFDSDLSMTDTTVSNNTNGLVNASSAAGVQISEGGTVKLNTVTISNSTISNNVGGLGVFSDVTTRVSGSFIEGNGLGGLDLRVDARVLDNLRINNNSGIGIRAEGPSILLQNSVISHNANTGAVINSNGAADATATIRQTSLTYNSGGLLTRFAYLSELTISNNSTTFGVGGLDAKDTVLENVTVSDNTASESQARAGGIYGTNLSISNSRILGNITGGKGGGIRGAGGVGDMSLSNTVVADNTAAKGGGIYFQSGTLSIVNSDITGNTASTGDGGGISMRATPLFMQNTSVSGNSATGKGGGINVRYSVFGSDAPGASIQSSTISANSSANKGGGLYIGNNTFAYIVNSTISGNISATSGGGLSATSVTDETLLRNSTLSGNTAVLGGGLYTAASNSKLNLVATIVANSTGGGDCGNQPLDGGSNWFEDASCNGSAQGSAMLGLLANNGGETYTQALLPGSGAINAAGQCELDTDQIGTTRSVCSCDIGAYEVPEAVLDNGSCKGQFFIVPGANGKTAIFSL